VDGVAADRARLTNDGRNLVRDAFTGDSVPAIDDIAVGDDASNLSRSNTDLESELSRASVATGGSGTTATFSASLTASGVTEVGLFAAQTLVCRLTLDAPVDVSGTVTVTLETDNDASVDRGVITTTGQAVVRDILASDSPALPTQYAYGRGQSAPAETDTALDDRAASLSLGDIVVQTADTTSEFDAITSVSATDPFVIANGEIALSQTAFTEEWENASSINGPNFFFASRFSGNGPDAGDGEALEYDGSGQSASYTFTPDHTIPASEFELFIRVGANNAPELEATLDGDTWQIFDSGGTIGGGPQWGNVTGADFGSDPFPGGDIAGGQSHTLEIASVSSGGTDAAIYIDLVTPVDSVTRFTGASDASGAHFFDNTLVDGSDGGRYLDGPQLFPAEVPLSLADESSRRAVTSLSFDSTWTDVSNNQFIEVSVDGTNFIRRDNTQTGSVTFDDGGQTLAANLGFSRFGSRDDATPQTGFNGQAIQLWELIAEVEGITPSDIGAVNVRAIAPTGDLSAESDNLTEGGQRDASGNLLSRSIFPAFPIGSQTRVESSEETTFTQE
jgi:hypothetical protein